MSQLAIILTFVLIGARGLDPGPVASASDHPLWQYLWGFALICGLGLFATARLSRIMDERGSIRAAMSARRASELMRLAAVGLHAWNILALGWVEFVRSRVGDPVLIDELLCAAPVFATWLISWWAIAPVERRLHEAILLRMLETGGPVYPPLSRVGYTWLTFRHQALFLIVPIVSVLAWGECVDRLGPRFGWGEREGDMVDLRALGAHLAGIALVFAAMPFMLRVIWDTVPLGEGGLRRELLEIATHAGSRFRELLVWRTRGQVVNGLVVGISRRTRHVLLSDALLDSLPARQLHAVAAHEYGHIRRKHVLWLGVAILTMAFAMGTFIDLAARQLTRIGVPDDLVSWWLNGASIVLGLSAFGLISRRFEWQADAFAVQCLSGGWRRGRPVAGITISAEAVGEMVGALDSVASFNGIPRSRYAWRHGSIASRQDRLSRLIGLDSTSLPIDRQVAWIKLATLVIFVGALAYTVIMANQPM